MPVIVPIEVISFLSRPISLSLRLAANMLAGHTMLKVFAGFVVSLLGAGGIFSALSIAPLLAGVALTALEVLVAAVQAWVFAMLTCIYLNEAVHLHDHH
jgi:F-type H+-transporting ATPase subunit a